MITIDHITNVVNAMDLSVVVNSVDSLGNGLYKMYTSNTKWATFGKTLDTYKIKEVAENSYIIVSSTVALSKGIYYLQVPYLLYGTLVDTNKVMNKKAQANTDRTPFIYLHLNASESYKGDFEMIDFESDCAFYFMYTSDPKNWLTGDYITNCIKPMKAMCNEFISKLKEYPYVNASNNLTYTINNDIAFGEIINRAGDVAKKYFTDNLAGNELLITIPFNKYHLCEN